MKAKTCVSREGRGIVMKIAVGSAGLPHQTTEERILFRAALDAANLVYSICPRECDRAPLRIVRTELRPSLVAIGAEDRRHSTRSGTDQVCPLCAAGYASTKKQSTWPCANATGASTLGLVSALLRLFEREMRKRRLQAPCGVYRREGSKGGLFLVESLSGDGPEPRASSRVGQSPRPTKSPNGSTHSSSVVSSHKSATAGAAGQAGPSTVRRGSPQAALRAGRAS